MRYSIARSRILGDLTVAHRPGTDRWLSAIFGAEMAPAVGIGSDAAVEVDERTPQPHGDGTGGAVADGPVPAGVADGADRGDDGGGAGREGLGDDALGALG